MWVATGSYAEPLQSDEQPESWNAFTPDLHTARLTANRMREMNFDYRMNKLCPTLTAPGFFSHQSDMLDVSGARAWDSNRFIRDFVRHNMHAHYMHITCTRTHARLPPCPSARSPRAAHPLNVCTTGLRRLQVRAALIGR